MYGTPIALTPWRPSDLPTLRTAYSDRTAALMAYLAAFAYDTRIEAKGALQVPPELAAFGFEQIDFVSQRHDRWLGLYCGGGGPHCAIVFKKLIHPDNTDQQLRVHEGFYRAFAVTR